MIDIFKIGHGTLLLQGFIWLIYNIIFSGDLYLAEILYTIYPLISQFYYNKHSHYRCCTKFKLFITLFTLQTHMRSEILLLVVICLAIGSQARHQVSHKRHLLESSNGTRTDTLYLRCPAPRAQFYKNQRNDSKSAGRLEINNAIKLNGDAFIYNLLTKNNSGANQQINKSKGNIVLYVIFLALGLLAMIILTPIFIFCCCKPQKCPPCAKMRQPQNQKYTNCQRKWSAIPIIVLAIVAIGTMIAVLVINPALQKGYSQTRCSVAMLFDDLLNGNYTKDGQQYFMGLKPLQSRINSLNNSLQSLLTQASGVSDGGKILNQILQNIKSIKHEVADLPRGDGSAKHLQLTYSSPINKALSLQHIQISSNFPSILGTNQTDESLVGQTYDKLTKVEHKLVSLSQLANLIDTALPKLRQTFDASLQKYASLVNVVQDKNKQTDQQLSDVQSKYVTPLSVVIYIIACIVIVFSVVIIIASMMICCFNKLSCRKVVYGSCGVLTLMGILCFVISLGLSAATVGSHYGCNYVQTGILTKPEFVYKFEPIFKNRALTQLMAECAAKEGSGNVLQRALESDILSELSNKHQTLKQNEDYNIDYLIEQLDSSKKHLIETIELYHNAEVADINSIVDLQILEKLSNPALFTCSSPGFLSDSWVPSVSQTNVYVTCKVPPTAKVTIETCKTIQQFQSSGPGCTGCIDTFSIFSEFDSQVQILDALNRRYSSPDCSTFNQQLANSWHNYYGKKSSSLAPISERAHMVQQRIDDLNYKIKTQFNEVIKSRNNHLQSILDPVINPSTPTSPTNPTSPTIPTSPTTQPALDQVLPQPITQVNCKVLGEDFELVTQTFCTQMFNYSFSMRILMIIGGFSLLGIMIFATFLGVRTYKSQNLSDRSSSYKNNPDDADTANKVNDPSAFAY